jgi:hypothetical protein
MLILRVVSEGGGPWLIEEVRFAAALYRETIQRERRGAEKIKSGEGPRRLGSARCRGAMMPAAGTPLPLSRAALLNWELGLQLQKPKAPLFL